jgi:hypothetical protein
MNPSALSRFIGVQLTGSDTPIATPWCPSVYLGYSLKLEFHKQRIEYEIFSLRSGHGFYH